jgi:FixJ family two-component response regulator
MLHVIAGKLNKQIAADLGAAESTIKKHRGRIMKKMRVVSVADLVRAAERLSVGK